MHIPICSWIVKCVTPAATYIAPRSGHVYLHVWTHSYCIVMLSRKEQKGIVRIVNAAKVAKKKSQKHRLASWGPVAEVPNLLERQARRVIRGNEMRSNRTTSTKANIAGSWTRKLKHWRSLIAEQRLHIILQSWWSFPLCGADSVWLLFGQDQLSQSRLSKEYDELLEKPLSTFHWSFRWRRIDCF